MKLLSAVAIALLFTLQLAAQNASNPIEIALLCWYQANTAAQLATCAGPGGIAFDGSHIWVGCGTANEVQEFNASDGALVRTITTADPYAIVYDGANIWAANYSGDGLTKINAATGAVSTPVSGLNEPSGMAFDGTNIWVTNYGGNSLSKVVATTGTVAATYLLSPSCTTPYGIAYAAGNLWVACHNSNVVAEVSSVTGAILTTVAVQQEPISVVFDGRTSQTNGPFIWVTNNSSATVSKISTTTFSVANFAAGPNPYGMVYDGLYIWVANPQAGTVTKLSQSTGGTIGSYSTGGTLPTFMGFDGGNVHVSNLSSNTISKM